MAGSVEYDVLVRHTVNLQQAVKENLTPLGAQLVTAQIITPDQYEEIRNTRKTVYERGAELVGYVQNKVRQDPRYYQAFIAALKSDLSQYGDILTKLEETSLPVAAGQQPVIPQPPSRERPGGNRLPAQGILHVCVRIGPILQAGWMDVACTIRPMNTIGAKCSAVQ
jgi:hypothetical protein